MALYKNSAWVPGDQFSYCLWQLLGKPDAQYLENFGPVGSFSLFWAGEGRRNY